MIIINFMNKIVKCGYCGKEFETPKKSRYPRKYCDKCSQERKEAYEKIDEIEFEDCDDE